ncbi:hypothetical protein SY88_08755 [Clostridiales bacterium PH28_bin88]|nr:hypothetical protein SY88_08755 [Clostridiales bacterium PH28_bin88]
MIRKSTLTIADVKEVVTEARLKAIDTDSILESGYIEAFIEDAPFSPFITVGNSEKPDPIAAKILEGRVAILVDVAPLLDFLDRDHEPRRVGLAAGG